MAYLDSNAVRIYNWIAVLCKQLCLFYKFFWTFRRGVFNVVMYQAQIAASAARSGFVKERKRRNGPRVLKTPAAERAAKSSARKNKARICKESTA
jgi:hypothetical protein